MISSTMTTCQTQKFFNFNRSVVVATVIIIIIILMIILSQRTNDIIATSNDVFQVESLVELDRSVPVIKNLAVGRSSNDNLSKSQQLGMDTPLYRFSLASVSALSTVPATTFSPRKFLICKPPMVGGRLGNEMFMYASLFGIARRWNRVPIYRSNSVLRTYFKISAEVSEHEDDDHFIIQEYRALSYDKNMDTINTDRPYVVLKGWLQSWKYFRDLSFNIRTEFSFSESTLSVVSQMFNDIKTSFFSATSSQPQLPPLFIGVHIRRGDMMDEYNVVRGYVVADKDYLDRAVKYMQDKHGGTHTLIYVVCTDDIKWSRTNFYQPFTYFSEKHSEIEDLAILANCNHTITTVGTYSWWGGYLAGGDVIYYKGFPKSGSTLTYLFTAEDFFLPDWIGL